MGYQRYHSRYLPFFFQKIRRRGGYLEWYPLIHIRVYICGFTNTMISTRSQVAIFLFVKQIIFWCFIFNSSKKAFWVVVFRSLRGKINWEVLCWPNKKRVCFSTTELNISIIKSVDKLPVALNSHLVEKKKLLYF